MKSMLQFYCRNATGVRLHNVYGPDQRKGTLLYALMNSEKVSLYNGGMNTRCFTYIDDVVDGLIYAIGSDKKLVNIVNPESCTILQFAEEVRKYNGVDIQCVSEKREFDNPVQSVDEGIFSVPLNYTSVSKGIAKVLAVRKGRKIRIDDWDKPARGWRKYERLCNMQPKVRIHRKGGFITYPCLQEQRMEFNWMKSRVRVSVQKSFRNPPRN